jgi:hypothetical protein
MCSSPPIHSEEIFLRVSLLQWRRCSSHHRLAALTAFTM